MRNSGRIVGVFYAVTNQIAHYHAAENLIMISPADYSRLRAPCRMVYLQPSVDHRVNRVSGYTNVSSVHSHKNRIYLI